MESQDPKAASLILKFKEAAKAAEEIDDYDSEVDEEDDDEEEVVSSGFGVERNGQVLKKKKELVVSGGKKRATAAGSGGCMAAPCCQVENCGADLTEAKRYYRRHKVCEVHAKSPLVVMDGIQQRFCQQCSRFHELSEFDEMRRSCRSRLAGHNERRRKLSSETNREEASSRQGSNPQLKENERRLVDDEGGRITVAHQAKNIQFR